MKLYEDFVKACKEEELEIDVEVISNFIDKLKEEVKTVKDFY